jgi:hypothetical protein
MSPKPVSVYHTQLQTLCIKLIATFTRHLFTVTSIWVEPSSPSYIELDVVPNEPQRLSPPDAKLEVILYMRNWPFSGVRKLGENFKPQWVNAMFPAVKPRLILEKEV